MERQTEDKNEKSPDLRQVALSLCSFNNNQEAFKMSAALHAC